MNDVFFVCATCKTYHDAGGKWCYIQLERLGIVAPGARVEAASVLQMDDYWNGAELEEAFHWVRPLLPGIRKFLAKHKDHDLTYHTQENFLWHDEEYLWMDEGEPEYADKSPRFFVEKLGITDWDEVVAFYEVGGPCAEPLWWGVPSQRANAKAMFEAIVEDKVNRNSQ